MYLPGHGNYWEFVLKQMAAFMVLPILLYVALVLSARRIIIVKWLGYEGVYQWRYDCEEVANMFPIAIFGVGLLNFFFVLPASLVLLPIAFYWLLFKMWQGVYVKFIK